MTYESLCGLCYLRGVRRSPRRAGDVRPLARLEACAFFLPAEPGTSAHTRPSPCSRPVTTSPCSTTCPAPAPSPPSASRRIIGARRSARRRGCRRRRRRGRRVRRARPVRRDHPPRRVQGRGGVDAEAAASTTPTTSTRRSPLLRVGLARGIRSFVFSSTGTVYSRSRRPALHRGVDDEHRPLQPLLEVQAHERGRSCDDVAAGEPRPQRHGASATSTRSAPTRAGSSARTRPASRTT